MIYRFAAHRAQLLRPGASGDRAGPDPRWTASQPGVRFTLDRARQAYGKRLSVAPHPYFDNGHTLTVDSPDRRFALVMESNDSGRIITLRGGRWPDVGWLEGCS